MTPYPRAAVSDHPDPEPDEASSSLLPQVTGMLRVRWPRWPNSAAGHRPPPIELSDDPVLASHQIAALAPIPVIDQYTLLAARPWDCASRPSGTRSPTPTRSSISVWPAT